ncbi:hypothetical protein [Actimicrobium antarcticum]|uniref:Uncharacterized protein n=1 Tax=Actimicrobium antarcticum TaxID=1051899 RepID=A0ABP7TES4_9BURK
MSLPDPACRPASSQSGADAGLIVYSERTLARLNDRAMAANDRTMEKALEITNLHARYGASPILRDAN